jgi:hypothetical protein
MPVAYASNTALLVTCIYCRPQMLWCDGHLMKEMGGTIRTPKSRMNKIRLAESLNQCSVTSATNSPLYVEEDDSHSCSQEAITGYGEKIRVFKMSHVNRLQKMWANLASFVIRDKNMRKVVADRTK